MSRRGRRSGHGRRRQPNSNLDPVAVGAPVSLRLHVTMYQIVARQILAKESEHGKGDPDTAGDHAEGERAGSPTRCGRAGAAD